MRATTILTGVTLVTCMLSLGCSEDDESDGTTSSGETGGAGADVTGGAGAESSGGEGGGSGAGSARPAPEVRLIDDCDDGDTETLLGGSWLSFDDADAGGDAVIEPLTDPFPDGPGFHMTAPGFGGAGYAAMVTGELTGIGSHAGLTVTLGASALCPTPMPFDVSEWDGIRFRAKGSVGGAGDLVVLLPHTADTCKDGQLVPDSLTGGFADYNVHIEGEIEADWTLFELDFRRDFAQPDEAAADQRYGIAEVLAHLKQITWLLQDADAEFEVWIDDVALY